MTDKPKTIELPEELVRQCLEIAKNWGYDALAICLESLLANQAQGEEKNPENKV